jgi:hypothetical protein
MKITRIVVIPLVGLLVILGACASPAATMPVATAPAGSTLPALPAPVAATPPIPAPVTPISPAPAPAPGQTVFIVSELKLDPAVVVLGDYMKVSVKVTNTGKERGTYTVVIRFDGNTVGTQDVALDGGSSGAVELNLVMIILGEHTVTVDQLTTMMEVVSSPP